jgi:hypothetical protein
MSTKSDWNFAGSWRAVTDALRGRGPNTQGIQPGATFRRRNYGNVEEMVRVVSLYTDAQNVQHVRFDLRIRRQDGGMFDFGSRSLGIEAFAGVYREQDRKVG